jgi:hypothetical protein
MTKEEKDGILAAVLDIPTPLKTVEIEPKNIFQKVLVFLRIRKPGSEMLYLRELKMSTNYRLTAMANALNGGSDQDGDIAKTMDLINQNTYQMAAYLATAIHNHKSQTPKHLIDSIYHQFSNKELHEAIKEVYRRLDVQSFFGCMELAGKLSLM